MIEIKHNKQTNTATYYNPKYKTTLSKLPMFMNNSVDHHRKPPRTKEFMKKLLTVKTQLDVDDDGNDEEDEEDEVDEVEDEEDEEDEVGDDSEDDDNSETRREKRRLKRRYPRCNTYLSTYLYTSIYIPLCKYFYLYL